MRQTEKYTHVLLSNLIILFIILRYEPNATTKGVFSGVTDRFNGITVDSQAEICEETQFNDLLSSNEIFLFKLLGNKVKFALYSL